MRYILLNIFIAYTIFSMNALSDSSGTNLKNENLSVWRYQMNTINLPISEIVNSSANGNVINNKDEIISPPRIDYLWKYDERNLVDIPYIELEQCELT